PVLEVEDGVDACPEGAVHESLHGPIDGEIDSLDDACQDVRPEVGLVDVHADSPDALLLRRLQRPQAAEAGNGKHDARSVRDLPGRCAPSLRGLSDGAVPLVHGPHTRNGTSRSCLVAGDERVDRAEAEAADGPDDGVATGVTALHQSGEIAGEVAALLNAKPATSDV